MRPDGRLGRLIGAVAAVALVVTVLLVARPASVWRLLAATEPRPLAVALALFAASAAVRGLRLVLLLPPRRLRPLPAFLVVTGAQAAALFLPLRAGELALPLLLQRTAGWDLTSGVGTLLAARALDLAALGLWAAAAVLAVAGLRAPAALGVAAALLLLPLLLPAGVAALDRTAVRCLARRGERGRRWTRQVRRLRRTLDELRQRPGRLAGAFLASVTTWGGIWAYTWFLLAAMGYRWPASRVIAGSAAASLSNLVPVNLIANLGTLEAGWTAAFTALGVPLEQAAASGLAAHLWALLFAGGLGAAGWGGLAIRGSWGAPPPAAIAAREGGKAKAVG